MPVVLINNTKSVSKIGALVAVDPQNTNAFIYATPNSTRALGVVAEAVWDSEVSGRTGVQAGKTLEDIKSKTNLIPGLF